MYEFDAATTVTPAGDSRWNGEIVPGWDIGGRPNGGYTLAIAARAGLYATGRDDPLAVSGHFLRPPETGPVEITTRILRTGRTVSAASVDLARAAGRSSRRWSARARSRRRRRRSTRRAGRRTCRRPTSASRRWARSRAGRRSR